MNHKKEISKDLPMIIDGLLLGVCLGLSYWLRASGMIRLDFLHGIPSFSESYWMLTLIVPASPLLLDMQGYYDHPLSEQLELLFVKIAKAGFWLILIISMCSVFARLEVPSRTVLILFLALSPGALILRSEITKKIVLHHYRAGRLGERSILIGTVADSNDFLSGLTPGERLELQITELLSLDHNDIATITRKTRQQGVDRVIFTSPESPLNADLPSCFKEEGIDVWIVSRSINGIIGAPIVGSAGKNRVLVFNNFTSDFWYRLTKRAIDVLGSTIALLLLSPLFLGVAAAIRLTSPGPVIFRQVRSGKRGRRFTILKFRSMIENAPALHADLARNNEMTGPVFKISRDPRITPIGAFLRRSSLDELPQLVNVLRGEMSLVGPRPLPDYETELIEKSTHRRRLSVKPGITCLWQIRGRSSIKCFEDWVCLDIEYIDHASLMLDLWIILQTIPIVIFRKGAQ